ncbi:hypothetical protein PHYC_01651 [Phycisphaerales bacterium]|nr:hypothetical protein PHYC_01651 [Phycisphaerales bacterium]
MAYTTEHHAREWFGAAALMVCHDYNLRCQYLPEDKVRKLLEATYEIDVHARLASFFGPAATIAAQGRGELDVVVSTPPLRAEVKYLMLKPPVYVAGIKEKDWPSLLAVDPANGGFAQFAWVVFCPSARLYPVTRHISVPKAGNRYSLANFAPLSPVVEPIMYRSSDNCKLEWRANSERVHVIHLPDGKCVRVDLIGSLTDFLWALVFTRLDGAESPSVAGAKAWTIDATLISPVRRAGDDAD